MRLLLDTHILLWTLDEPERLPVVTRDVIESPDNEVLFSAASVWEIAIRSRLGRSDFQVRPERIASEALETGFIELPVSARIAARVVDLPLYHRDPFDRLLVMQAIAEGARLYTRNKTATIIRSRDPGQVTRLLPYATAASTRAASATSIPIRPRPGSLIAGRRRSNPATAPAVRSRRSVCDIATPHPGSAPPACMNRR